MPITTLHATVEDIVSATEMAARYAPATVEPLNAFPFKFVMDGITLEGMMLHETTHVSGMRLTNIAPVEKLTFASVTQGSLLVRDRSQEYTISADHPALFDSSTLKSLDYRPGTTYKSVTMEKTLLVAGIERLTGRSAGGRFTVQEARVDRALQSSVQDIADCIRDLARDRTLVGASIVANNLRDAIINLILTRHPHSHSAQLKSSVRAHYPATIVRAMDFIDNNIEYGVTTASVAAAIGIGLRSLQLTFARDAGIAPSEYIRLSRLRRAREDIIGGRCTSVAAAALKWQFNSPSQFSRRYFYAFGEYPSHTLRHYK